MKKKVNNIGIKPQEVETGKEVYYYSYASKYSNSAPVKVKFLEDKVYEICDTLCCKVDKVSSVVALENLSFEYYPEKHITEKQLKAKERYQNYIHSECLYSFGEFLKYKIYKNYEED